MPVRVRQLQHPALWRSRKCSVRPRDQPGGRCIAFRHRRLIAITAPTAHVFNAKAAWQFNDGSDITLIANAVDLPDAQDPLDLRRFQLDTNREQAGAGALAY